MRFDILNHLFCGSGHPLSPTYFQDSAAVASLASRSLFLTRTTVTWTKVTLSGNYGRVGQLEWPPDWCSITVPSLRRGSSEINVRSHRNEYSSLHYYAWRSKISWIWSIWWQLIRDTAAIDVFVWKAEWLCILCLLMTRCRESSRSGLTFVRVVLLKSKSNVSSRWSTTVLQQCPLTAISC